MSNVIIISQGNEVTGINKYAINTYKAIKDSAELYFIKFRKVHGNYGIGKVVEGKFSYGNSIFNLNTLFPRLAYSHFIEYVRNRKENGSIIHVASPHVLKVALGFDNVVTIHDMVPFTPYGQNGIEYKITRRLYSHYLKYDHILTISDTTKSKILEAGANGNVKTIYPYISDKFRPLDDRIQLRKKYGLPIDKKLLISVSTNIARKNLKILPKILSILGSQYKLVRIGERIGDSYAFNPADEMEMNEIYNACDIFISTSLDEGFGYPVIEALKAGIAVTVSDIPVHREILGDSGSYFDVNSPIGAANSVRNSIQIYQDGYKYPKKWLNKFTFDTFKSNIENYYKTIE